MSYNAALQALTTLAGMVSNKQQQDIQRESAQLDRESRERMQTERLTHEDDQLWDKAAITSFETSQLRTDELLADAKKAGLTTDMIAGLDEIDRTAGSKAITARKMDDIQTAINNERRLQNVIRESVSFYELGKQQFNAIDTDNDDEISLEELNKLKVPHRDSQAFLAGLSSQSKSGMELAKLAGQLRDNTIKDRQADYIGAQTSNITATTEGILYDTESKKLGLQVQEQTTEEFLSDKAVQSREEQVVAAGSIATDEATIKDTEATIAKESVTADAVEDRKRTRKAQVLSAELVNTKQSLENDFATRTLDTNVAIRRLDKNIKAKDLEILDESLKQAKENTKQAKQVTARASLDYDQAKQNYENNALAFDNELADKTIDTLEKGIVSLNQAMLSHGTNIFAHMSTPNSDGTISPLMSDLAADPAGVNNWLDKIDSSIKAYPMLGLIRKDISDLLFLQTAAQAEEAVNNYELTANKLHNIYEDYKDYERDFRTWVEHSAESFKEQLENQGISSFITAEGTFKDTRRKIEDMKNKELYYYYLTNVVDSKSINRESRRKIAAWSMLGMFTEEGVASLRDIGIARKKREQFKKLRLEIADEQALMNTDNLNTWDDYDESDAIYD